MMLLWYTIALSTGEAVSILACGHFHETTLFQAPRRFTLARAVQQYTHRACSTCLKNWEGGGRRRKVIVWGLTTRSIYSYPRPTFVCVSYSLIKIGSELFH